MVNVAGRSKGCSTCRKRRVKCDETSPICRRCQRGGFACDGPREGLTIIHDRKSAQVRRDCYRTQVGGGGADGESKAVSPWTPPPSPEAALSIAGSELYICYTRAHLIRQGLVYSSIEKAKLDDLVPTVAAPKTRLANQALLSFATMLFGAQHRQEGIKHKGYALHGEALKRLNLALADSSRCADDDDVIVAVSALAISEGLVPTGPDNYLKHMLGLEKLLALRDPFAFWSRNARGLCEGVRFMVLFACLLAQRPSVVARADWKEAMRLHTPPEHLKELELWHVLADCTVLIAKCRELNAIWNVDGSDAVRLRSEVELSARVLLAQLDVWRDRHNEVAALRTSHTEPDNKRNAFNVFGVVDEHWAFAGLPIADDAEAIVLMLYNVARGCILDALAALPTSSRLDEGWYPPSIAQDTHQLTAELYRAQGRLAALENCRLLHYYLSGHAVLTPSTSVTVHWAIGTAWQRLRGDDGVEARWVRDVTGRQGRQILSDGVFISYRVFRSIPT